MKLTAKQEQFVQSYIETGNASEAYRRAYSAARMKPETVTRNAHALLGRNNVATRLAELHAKHQKRHEITIDSLTVDLEEDRQLAVLQGQASAAVSATLGKAKLHGLLRDKVDLAADASLMEVMRAIDGRTRGLRSEGG